MPAPGEQHMNHGGKPIVNPFEEVKPKMSEYTAQEIATLQSRLEKQLGPEYISSRAGPSGQKVHYLAAEKCIQLANEVFGFNGWSSQIMNLQVDFMDENSTTLKVSLGLSVIVRVTLRDGSFHEDIGYGHIENCKGKAAAFEKAKKEGTTDALKRALRNFGNVLGNCIYDKDYLSKVTKIKVQPTKWDVEGLHRHSDYAPAKKNPEVVAPDSKSSGVPIIGNGDILEDEWPDTNTILATGESMDDEFGDFDDTFADFVQSDPDAHPDEVVLPAPKAPSHMNEGYVGPSAPNGGPMPAPAKTLCIPRATILATNRPAGAMHNNQPPKTPNGLLARSLSGADGYAIKSHEGNGIIGLAKNEGGGLTKILNQPSRKAQNSAPTSPQQSKSYGVTDENDFGGIPAGALNVGFLSAKAADMLPQDGNISGSNQALSNLPTFNPRAESPSIRRTPGIDHNSTKPLARDGKHRPGSTQQSNQVQGTRTSIMNPQLDATRRIGAPGSPSPMANRGSYKPPTMKRTSDGANPQRPPLGDVAANGSVAANAGGDSKRQRMNGI